MTNARLGNIRHILESILGNEDNDDLQSLLTVWAVINENKDRFADRSEFDADVASFLERSPDLGLEPIVGIEREVRSPSYFVIQRPRFRDEHKGQVRVIEHDNGGTLGPNWKGFLDPSSPYSNSRLRELFDDILEGAVTRLTLEPIKLEITSSERGVTNKPVQIEILFDGFTREPDGTVEESFGRSLFISISPSSVTHPAQEMRSISSEHHSTLAKYWVDECLQKHKHCNEGWNGFVPARLLQIDNSGTTPLVKLYVTHDTDSGIRYCTVSHCWGDPQTVIQLKINNLSAFQENIAAASLSEKFQDAVILTRKLGFQFLWIDSLCIIQDSNADWTKEASMMSKIYQNSACTIAAGATGSAQGGCFATRNPLTYAPCRIAGNEKKGLVASFANSNRGTIIEALSHSPLASRGWIFQERLICSRTLHYGSQGIFWTCLLGHADETSPNGTGFPNTGELLVDRHDFFGPSVQQLTWTADSYLLPGMSNFQKLLAMEPLQSGTLDPEQFNHWWMRLVWEYTKCQLTKGRDKLIAMSGIIFLVQAKSGFHYLAGLWTESLLFNLCWFVTSEPQARPAEYRAPSWSWASAEGIINTYYQLGHEKQLLAMAEVVSTNITSYPADSNGLGLVSSGSVKLSGRLRKLETPLHEWNQTVVFEGSYIIYDGELRLGRFFPDAVLLDEEPQPLYLMPLICFTSGQKNEIMNYCGLVLSVLSSSRETHYRRCGLFVFRSKDLADAVHDWFEDVADQNVEVR